MCHGLPITDIRMLTSEGLDIPYQPWERFLTTERITVARVSVKARPNGRMNHIQFTKEIKTSTATTNGIQISLQSETGLISIPLKQATRQAPSPGQLYHPALDPPVHLCGYGSSLVSAEPHVGPYWSTRFPIRLANLLKSEVMLTLQRVLILMSIQPIWHVEWGWGSLRGKFCIQS